MFIKFAKISLLVGLFLKLSIASKSKIAILRSSIQLSCLSTTTPIWNRIKSLESVQSIAYGDTKTPRFKDDRYVWQSEMRYIYIFLVFF